MRLLALLIALSLGACVAREPVVAPQTVDACTPAAALDIGRRGLPPAEACVQSAGWAGNYRAGRLEFLKRRDRELTDLVNRDAMYDDDQVSGVDGIGMILERKRVRAEIRRLQGSGAS